MHLTAVLLNPVPHLRPKISRRNVGVAASVLRATSFSIANLIHAPTVDLPQLSEVGQRRDLWVTSRTKPGKHLALATRLGHTEAFLVNGEPRHPSSWRQYVGPRHNRYAGDTFDQRLLRALRAVPLSP